MVTFYLPFVVMDHKSWKYPPIIINKQLLYYYYTVNTTRWVVLNGEGNWIKSIPYVRINIHLYYQKPFYDVYYNYYFTESVFHYS